MECDISPAKRRKISHANSESNEDPNLNVIEESPMDTTEEIGSQIRVEDTISSQILGSGEDDGHLNSRKKLLVLDVNGLLVDIVLDPDEAHKPDTTIGPKAVFKRPYCDEFLKFCFERFSVGVWTSRTRRNIKQVLDFLMKDTQHQLLFCWDQSQCTETGVNTIDNNSKPLVLKELKKLWEKQDPKLPWDKGVFDESNTLLLDDSPYKALLNPPYTAIFPYTYSYRDTQDNGLGPDGDLRNYLEKLAASDNIQKFIEQNPFGQPPISHENESWDFYHKIICSNLPRAGPSRFRKKLLIIDIDGLLVDVTSTPRKGYRADTWHGSTAVFKRPYCDEFLRFCFKKFNVGVWSSTTRYNTKRALDFLMSDDTQHKLLFCWDLSDCTDTGFSTVENRCKRINLKELKKIWEKKDPNLPWKLGEYDESNTLLLEHVPHKALLNPPHTAIFPYPYRYWETEDNSLGPKGDLRIYLEKLAASENVPKFVSDYPFGQRPIREQNLSWNYYLKVIHAFSRRKGGDSVDAQCKNSSESKPETTIASVTKNLSEPETDTSSALAAPTLLEQKTVTTTDLVDPTSLEPENISTTVLTAPTLLEPETDTTIAMVGQSMLGPETTITADLAAPTLLEPETIITADLAAPTLLEPKTITTTDLAAPTLLEPETVSTTDLAAPTLLEPETISTTDLAAPTLLEPETITTTDMVAPTLLEPETISTTDLAAPTLLEPETIIATVLAAPLEPEATITTDLAASTLLEPETIIATDLVAPTLLELETTSTTDLSAPTLLEPETIITTDLAALTLLKPETSSTDVMVGQTLLEPEIKATAPADQILLEPESCTSRIG